MSVPGAVTFKANRGKQCAKMGNVEPPLAAGPAQKDSRRSEFKPTKKTQGHRATKWVGHVINRQKRHVMDNFIANLPEEVKNSQKRSKTAQKDSRTSSYEVGGRSSCRSGRAPLAAQLD